MIKQEVLDNIKKYEQDHLLKYYDELSAEDKKIFEEQLNQLDFSYIDIFKNNDSVHNYSEDVYEPLGAMKLDEINSRIEEFKNAGIEALKRFKVGAVLLAGGQGTRLGFDKPKGMFNIGVNKEVYIDRKSVV